MGFEQIIFWLLAVGVVVTSALVVLPPGGKNPLYGALLLIVSFFFIAGLYVLLYAHMMAILQEILVYAGAIMVLFTFVIMLLNLSKKELGDETRTLAKGLGIVAVVALGTKLVVMLEGQALNIQSQPLPAGFGGVDSVADLLFHNYLVPFELTGVLLLVAVIGAVVLAKRTL